MKKQRDMEELLEKNAKVLKEAQVRDEKLKREPKSEMCDELKEIYTEFAVADIYIQLENAITFAESKLSGFSSIKDTSKYSELKQLTEKLMNVVQTTTVDQETLKYRRGKDEFGF